MKKRYIAIMLLLCVMISCMPMQVNAASKVKINKTKETLFVGKTLQLKVSGVAKNKIKWSVDKKNIVSINKNGKVTAKKKGKATVTAKVKKNGKYKKYKCKITTKNPYLNKKEITLDIEQSYQLKLIGAKAIKWEYDDFWGPTEDFTISKNGKITGKNSGWGAVVVTAKINGKKVKYKCDVNVTSKVRYPYGKRYRLVDMTTGNDRAITKKTVVLASGEYLDLSLGDNNFLRPGSYSSRDAYVLPTKIQSSNKNVVGVVIKRDSKNKIASYKCVPLAPGTAVLSFTAPNGEVRKCTVTVKSFTTAYPTVESMVASPRYDFFGAQMCGSIKDWAQCEGGGYATEMWWNWARDEMTPTCDKSEMCRNSTQYNMCEDGYCPTVALFCEHYGYDADFYCMMDRFKKGQGTPEEIYWFLSEYNKFLLSKEGQEFTKKYASEADCARFTAWIYAYGKMDHIDDVQYWMNCFIK